MDKVTITKLNGSNYQIWKFKLRLLLIKEDVWEIVNDALPPPDTRDAAWCKRDGKAMAWIGLLIEDNQLCHIRNQTTAKGAWDALKNVYEKATLTNKIYILKRLCRIQLTEGGNMEDHVNTVLDMVNDLSALGEDLKENLVVALLLVSLPESYDSLVTALESRSEEDLTLEMVKSKLISDFKRKRESNGEIKDPSIARSIAMIAKKQVYEQRTCYGCGKPGHFIQQCKNIKKPEYKTEEEYYGKFKSESERSKKIAQNHNYKSEESDEDESEQIAFMVSSKDDDNNWYIDSAATSNMSNKMNLFKNFNPNCNVPVTLANGTQTISKGIGEIELTCFNEFGEPQKVIMKEVLFIPDLDSCLLSVQKLTKRGLKVIFEKENCFIFRNGKIVATGSRHKNLYKLNYQYKMNQISEKKYPNFNFKIKKSSEIEIPLFSNDDDKNIENGESDSEEEIFENHNISLTGEINGNEIDLDETITINMNIASNSLLGANRGEENSEERLASGTPKFGERIERRSERWNKGKPPERHSAFKITVPN